MRSWWAFLSSGEDRNATAHVVLRFLSTVLPALAVQHVGRAVSGYATHSPGVDFLIWAGSFVLSFYVYCRISRWHDRQDQLDRERSRQEN